MAGWDIKLVYFPIIFKLSLIISDIPEYPYRKYIILLYGLKPTPNELIQINNT